MIQDSIALHNKHKGKEEYFEKFSFYRGVTTKGTYSSRDVAEKLLDEITQSALNSITSLNKKDKKTKLLESRLLAENARYLKIEDENNSRNKKFYLVTYSIDQILANVQQVNITQTTNIKDASKTLETFSMKQRYKLGDEFSKQIKRNKYK